MKVVGYSDPQSVAGGEAIRFMVSCTEARFEAQIVRLLHGDMDPDGPGFEEREIEATVNGRHPGCVQELHPGSYALVPETAALARLSSFSVRLSLFITGPRHRRQAVLSKRSPTRGGFSIELDERGSLSLVLADERGNVERLSTDTPLRTATWYHVGVAYDHERALARLVQRPFREWPLDGTAAAVELPTTVTPAVENAAPLVFAAKPADDGGRMTEHYNGKLSGPQLFASALEPDVLAGDDPRGQALAAWHFGLEADADGVVDVSGGGLDGRTVNMPTRGVTGPGWSGRETRFFEAPDEYDAIHFHDDDLVDAGWTPTLEWTVPRDLRSGVYALRLRCGGSEDYVPFYVRPAEDAKRAQIAFLAPVYSYLAYANEHYMADPQRQEMLDFDIERALAGATDYEREHYDFARNERLLSLYDNHSDGSGTCYASRLRPTVNMRPKYNWPSLGFEAPHQFNADLYLLDWLEQRQFEHDVITDEDLHHQGEELLSPYRVVITGSHPEYWTEPMLEALDRYLTSGGRLMYLGGNGFYWVTSVDPLRPHVIEIRRVGPSSRIWEPEQGEHYHSTTGERGGLWRYRNRVPQRLVGVGFTGQGYDKSSPYRRLPDSYDPRASFVFEGIDDEEVIGDFGLHLGGAAGYELDRCDYALGTPPHALRLAESFGHSDSYQHAVEEVLESDGKQSGPVNPLVRADMVLVEYPNDGAVFSVGSISWSGSLSHDHYDNNVSRITENVLTRFLSDEPLSPTEDG
jgi:N,N-dimethylformamidase